MSEIDNSTAVKSFWVQTAQTLGISTVVMVFLFYWCMQTINWERDQMLPAIQGSKVVLETNSEILKTTNDVLRNVKISIDGLTKTTQSQIERTSHQVDHADVQH